MINKRIPLHLAHILQNLCPKNLPVDQWVDAELSLTKGEFDDKHGNNSKSLRDLLEYYVSLRDKK